MANSAVPDYIRIAASKPGLPPGHRFSLFFPLWSPSWDLAGTEKGKALSEVISMNGVALEIARSIVQRQISLATTASDECLLLPCVSQSPFTTGLGNEHPLENGFSFLSPYGIPYLSGSGVKGVIRKAAEILALFPEEYHSERPSPDFCMLDVWKLFGFEGDGCSIFPKKIASDEDHAWRNAFTKQFPVIAARPDFKNFIADLPLDLEKQKSYLTAPISFLQELSSTDDQLRKSIHTRGTLTFWDSFPECRDMCVEIMTPHYSDYYQSRKAPHDSGTPNPLTFLAIPAGTKFLFVVQHRKEGISASHPQMDTVAKIFTFACKWQGFGAKTAIGYGAFRIDDLEQKKIYDQITRERQEAAEKREFSSLSEEQRKIRSFQALFEKTRKSGQKYQPGCSFDEPRLLFFKEALSWTNSTDRAKAADLLEETMKWGPPSKKRKEEFQENLKALRGG